VVSSDEPIRDAGEHLDEHLLRSVGRQIEEDRYGATSEVVRALIEGEQSGPSEPFDIDAFIIEVRRSANR
jgi:antitoxin ParD1/3/4